MNRGQRRRVLLRCDASPQLGIGHVARCQALAAALHARGAECILIGPEPEYRTSDVFRGWIPQTFRGTEADQYLADAESLAAMAKQYQADWIVLDDYRVNEAYQHVLRKHACRWLQFDGASAQTLWADVVLNSSPGVRAERYQARLANTDTQLLLGPTYAILRPEFASTNAPPEPAAAGKLERLGEATIRIYLNFGGGDDRGALRWCAQTLLETFPYPLHLKLVSGPQNPNNRVLAHWASNQGPQLEFLLNPPHVAAQLRECDLAILSGGMSCYEADSCGLDMVLVPLVPNQLAHARAWATHGRAKVLEGWPEVSPAALRAALLNCMVESRGSRPPKLTDGLGAQRVADFLMG